MRKTIFTFVLLLVFSAPAAKAACTTIQDGILVYLPGRYLAGQPLKPGFDPYGYNYQAHLFVGSYFNAYANGDGFPPYTGDDVSYLAANPTASGHWAWPWRSVTVNMKWNDAWLSNKDCNGDGKLDRPSTSTGYGDAYQGSGAWITNHMSDTYELDGQPIHWTYFVKMVAAPSSAYLCPQATCPGSQFEGIWYTDITKTTEIGHVIWGEDAIVQEIYNDPGAGVGGLLYKSPVNPGFGYWGKQP